MRLVGCFIGIITNNYDSIQSIQHLRMIKDARIPLALPDSKKLQGVQTSTANCRVAIRIQEHRCNC